MLRVSVLDHGWPAAAAVPAILELAADPQTKSPARLPCPGPWWEAAERSTASGESAADVAALEAMLAEVGGARVTAQREARLQLASEGLPVTRSSVAYRACQLLGLSQGGAS